MFRIAYSMQEVLVSWTAGRIYRTGLLSRIKGGVCPDAVGKHDDGASCYDDSVVQRIQKAVYFTP